MNKETIEKAARKYAFENAWYPGETSYESDIKAMEFAPKAKGYITAVKIEWEE